MRVLLSWHKLKATSILKLIRTIRHFARYNQATHPLLLLSAMENRVRNIVLLPGLVLDLLFIRPVPVPVPGNNI